MLLTEKLLPIPHPLDYDPSINDKLYFYREVIKPMVLAFIRLMDTGLILDTAAVEELRVTIDKVLKEVEEGIAVNPIIIEFQKRQYKKNKQSLIEEQKSKFRTIDYYLKEYNYTKIDRRTALINHWLHINNQSSLEKNKWVAKDIKSLESYLDIPLPNFKDIQPTEQLALDAMQILAQTKLDIYNKSKMLKVAEATETDLAPPFNPGSTKQLRELFEFLNIMPLKYSKKTNEASWGRDQIEEILKSIDKNTDLHTLLQLFIDHSFSGIIRANFLEAFDSFTINNILKGNLKAFGAKSFRPTSNNPNLLNMPSTGSIYAKPLKKCFVAPEGYLVWSIDFSALEDRVIANLSKDGNKLAGFTEGIDGHSLGATYYFPEKVAAIIGSYTDNKAAARLLKAEVDAGNKEAKAIRQAGKPVTFKLAYGGFPDSDKGGFITPEIFNAYHNEMYPGITRYKEQVIAFAQKRGYVHLGLGCRMYSSNIDKHARTLFNGCSQFFSVLTLLAMVDMYTLIDKSKYDIKINATIYDALYGYVPNTPEAIQWLNNTICPIMETQWLENEIVHNEANLELGTNWSNLIELPHNITLK